MIELINGDCLEEMDKLIERGIKVDAIICDPPYGTTACKWDSIIPFDEHMYFLINKKSIMKNKQDSIIHLCNEGMEYSKALQYFENNKELGMWYYLNKLIKPNGAIVLFGNEPFSSALRMSNIKNYKYDLIWKKNIPTGFFNAKKQQLKIHENISIFYNNQPVYNPQMVKRSEEEYKKNLRINDSECYNPSVYGGGRKKLIRKTVEEQRYKYPFTICEFKKDRVKTKDKHPTQKPIALMEYLVKTYTNEGELVLDFTMGSGSTMVACKNTNRNGIGIELDKGYFDISVERVNNVDKPIFINKPKKDQFRQGKLY